MGCAQSCPGCPFCDLSVACECCGDLVSRVDPRGFCNDCSGELDAIAELIAARQGEDRTHLLRGAL